MGELLANYHLGTAPRGDEVEGGLTGALVLRLIPRLGFSKTVSGRAILSASCFPLCPPCYDLYRRGNSWQTYMDWHP